MLEKVETPTWFGRREARVLDSDCSGDSPMRSLQLDPSPAPHLCLGTTWPTPTPDPASALDNAPHLCQVCAPSPHILYSGFYSSQLRPWLRPPHPANPRAPATPTSNGEPPGPSPVPPRPTASTCSGGWWARSPTGSPALVRGILRLRSALAGAGRDSGPDTCPRAKRVPGQCPLSGSPYPEAAPSSPALPSDIPPRYETV